MRRTNNYCPSRINGTHLKLKYQETAKGQAWWLTPYIISAQRLKQKDCHEFETSLGDAVRT